MLHLDNPTNKIKHHKLSIKSVKRISFVAIRKTLNSQHYGVMEGIK